MMSASSKMSFQHLCGFPVIHYVHLIQSSLYEKLLCEGPHSPIYCLATTIVGPRPTTTNLSIPKHVRNRQHKRSVAA